LSEIAVFLFSFLSSTLSPILGIGGGILNVPFLTLFIGAEFQAATSASLLAGAVLSFSATLQNAKKGKTYFNTAFALLPPIMLGAALGPFIPVHSSLLYALFGLFVVFIGYLMFTGSTETFKVKSPVLFNLLLFVLGILTSLLGIGGGVVLVPLLMFTQGLGIKRSVATSSFMTMFTMIVGFISHTLCGNLDPSLAIPLAIPAMFMGYFGAYLMVEKIERTTLRKAFSLFLFLIAALMLLKAFGLQ
jgi:uncharacterized protein